MASKITVAVRDASQKPMRPPIAAWLGSTPRPHSSRGRQRLGGITKRGEGSLRKLLDVCGAHVAWAAVTRAEVYAAAFL
ncbi:transposase [Sphingobium phenoxybenzoativorans]|uniref:transposase n=1 Tax=Sphingobium phenoxybenzoativorans TaxID=1592790 RepID=UPI0009F70E8A|nr:transposase [Sphingobium phenoxybenzoativorans]